MGARNQGIDLLRGVSIGLVLLHHFNIAYRLEDTLPAHLLGWPAVQAVVRNGNYGVTMFFVISGYLITSNALRRWGRLGDVQAAAFYRLRAARILPCAVLLVVAVNLLAACGIPIFRNHPETGGPVAMWLVDLASLTFWMNVLMARAGWINYVLSVQWSLSVEEVFYVSFPILCLLLKRERRLLAVWVAFIVIGPLWRAFHQTNDSGFLYAYPACFDAIATGCCTAVLARHVRAGAAWLRAMAAPCALAIIWLYLVRSIGQTNVLGVTAMSLGTALLILASRPAPRASTASTHRLLRPIAASGRLSYELYLFHLLVLGGLRTVFPPETVAGNAKLLLLAGYLALSGITASLIARFYAEKLNRWFRQGIGTDRATAEA